jgi:hypothetical protein
VSVLERLRFRLESSGIARFVASFAGYRPALRVDWRPTEAFARPRFPPARLATPALAIDDSGQAS